jgi:hypothetical protein
MVLREHLEKLGGLQPREIFGERLHLRVGEPTGDLAHHAARIVMALASLEIRELLQRVRRTLSGETRIMLAAGTALAVAASTRRYSGRPIAFFEELAAGRCERDVTALTGHRSGSMGGPMLPLTFIREW